MRPSQPHLARSRRRNFWTLPVEVFGNGPKTTVRGALKWARRVPQKGDFGVRRAHRRAVARYRGATPDSTAPGPGRIPHFSSDFCLDMDHQCRHPRVRRPIFRGWQTTALGREQPSEPGTKRMICTASNGGGRLVPISADCRRPHRRAPVSTKSTSRPPQPEHISRLCQSRTAVSAP